MELKNKGPRNAVRKLLNITTNNSPVAILFAVLIARNNMLCVKYPDWLHNLAKNADSLEMHK